MVSRRNFFTIAGIMFVILFMFQLSGVVKEVWNPYWVNQYAGETQTDFTSESSYTPGNTSEVKMKDYVIYIGNSQDNAAGCTVRQWCTYTKRNLIVEQTLQNIAIDSEHPPEAILLDSDYVDWNQDIPVLESLAADGMDLIFCNLPSFDIIANSEELKSILGITFASQENIELNGIKLFGGFLLGGEEIYTADSEEEQEYQDLDLTIPWYSVTSGTKTYMVGLLDKTEYNMIKNEYLPAIIWRNSIGKSRVFAVNGDYLDTNTGIGILDAIMVELHDYEIYPVVNAQSIVILNYPVVSDENKGEMYRRYSRSSKSVVRDIIWPGLVNLASRMNAKLTCMISPQMDYEDDDSADSDELEYYFKLIREQKGEVGLSTAQRSGLSLKDKFESDHTLLHNKFSSYKFTSIYTEESRTDEVLDNLRLPLLQDVRTLLNSYDEHQEPGAYASDNVLVMQATADGFSHTFSEDLRIKSLETSLGYSAIMADMERILYPLSEQDGWENLYNDFSRFTTTFWKDFTVFEQTTLSESDQRMRKLLALDYEDSREDNRITLKIKNLEGEGWFLLRVHGEDIADITGGTYEKIEKDVFLIQAKQDMVNIQLKKDGKLYYLN